MTRLRKTKRQRLALQRLGSSKWEHLLSSPLPIVGSFMQHVAVKQIARDALAGNPVAVKTLAKALISNPDDLIQSTAVETLKQIDQPVCINATWELWKETRHTTLTRLLVEMNHPATFPLDLKCLSLLQLDKENILRKVKPELVGCLLNACMDPDDHIRSNARETLLNLNNPDTQEALCQMICEEENPLTQQICLQANYLPQQIEKQVLFLFLCGEWNRYEILDFDQRIMRAIYHTANVPTRQRIARLLLQSGKANLLTILAGVDYRSPDIDITYDEAQTLINMLASNQEWEKIWKLSIELSPSWSLHCIQLLVQNQWSPSSEDDKVVFQQLVKLASLPMELDEEKLSEMLPLAVPRSKIRTNGRINAVCFSPTQLYLSIGTGAGKIVLWDYQKGEKKAVQYGFQHSIGNLAYTTSGLLLCSERSNTREPCAIYSCDMEHVTQLGQHQGSVTSIIPIDDQHLLSTGRDNRIVLWDMTAGVMVNEIKMRDWYRFACITSDRKTVILFIYSPTLFKLPDIKFIKTIPIPPDDRKNSTLSMVRTAACKPEGGDLWIGKHNGKVICYQEALTTVGNCIPKTVTTHSKVVKAIKFLPGHPIVITAGAEGEIRFWDSSNFELKATIPMAEGRLTSLQISADGSFMATGTNEAFMTLWDLRLIDIPILLSRSINSMGSHHLAEISALVEIATLPAPVINGLQFLQCLLRYRFGNDIQISEIPAIRPDEFDIVID